MADGSEAEKALATEPSLNTDSNTVRRILHNALDHFSKYGYSGASVREITNASQVTKPTLYYYFRNKEELYKRLSDSCFQEILTSLANAAAIEASTHDRIVNVIREYSRLAEERFSVVRFVHVMALSAEKNVPDVGIADFGDKSFELFKNIVQDGVEKGEVLSEKAECITYATLGIMQLRLNSMLVGKSFAKVEFSVIEEAIGCILQAGKKV